MKIVHLCLSSVYLDNHSYQENILPRYHSKLGHDVTVVASCIDHFDHYGDYACSSSKFREYTCDNYKVIRIPYLFDNKFFRYIRLYKNLRNVLLKEQADILFIHDFSFLDIRTVISYLKENKSVKVYVDCHTDLINSARSFISKYVFHNCIWRFYGKRLNPYVLKFYGVTPLRCSFLEKMYKLPNSKISLLNMGLDDELLSILNKNQDKEDICRKYGINKNNRILVSGGKIDPKKNIDTLVKAFTLLNQEDVSLIIFGSVQKSFEGSFLPLLKHPNIYFIGWLDQISILRLLNIADLAIFPGTHSVLWEQTVGLGIPCVFKYWEGMTHVKHSNNALILDAISQDSIFEALNFVFTDNNLQKLQDDAYSSSKIGFYYSTIALKSIDMYD